MKKGFTVALASLIIAALCTAAEVRFGTKIRL